MMTEKEIQEYGERVEAMAKKEPAYQGWGFFYFRPAIKKKEDYFTNYASAVLEMSKKQIDY